MVQHREGIRLHSTRRRIEGRIRPHLCRRAEGAVNRESGIAMSGAISFLEVCDVAAQIFGRAKCQIHSGSLQRRDRMWRLYDCENAARNRGRFSISRESEVGWARTGCPRKSTRSLVRNNPYGAIYDVVSLDADGFGVKVSIPDAKPTMASGFETEPRPRPGSPRTRVACGPNRNQGQSFEGPGPQPPPK